MATDRTEQLIVDLVAGMAPVHRLPGLGARMTRWLLLAMAVAAAGVWAIGLRPDLSHAVTASGALWSLGFAGLASASAALLALRLSVPGVDQTPWVRWMPMAIAGLWVATLIEMARDAGTAPVALLHEPFHGACVVRVAAISILPTLFLIRDIRRGLALDAASTAALAMLGGGALAAVAVQLVCPIDRPAHLLVSHLVPVLALVIAGGAAAAMLPGIVRRRMA